MKRKRDSSTAWLKLSKSYFRNVWEKNFVNFVNTDYEQTVPMICFYKTQPHKGGGDLNGKVYTILGLACSFYIVLKSYV